MRWKSALQKYVPSRNEVNRDAKVAISLILIEIKYRQRCPFTGAEIDYSLHGR